MEKAFAPLVVTPALRPTLRNQEPIVVVQNHVGLYEGLYLTPLRLLYVDRVNPHTRSLSLDLAQVKTAVAQAGFLTSSPKAVLTLRPKSMTAGDAPLSTAAASSIGWQCRICRHDNSGAAVKCALCGVTRPPIAAGDPSAPLTALACPACTFHNHLSMRDCELCGSPLRPAFGPPPTAPPASASPLPSDLLVKLSFRGGGSTSFFTALQTALREAAWARRPDPAPLPAAPTPTRAVGGISQIVSRVDASHRATDDTLTAAFQDLDALQAMAHEMVRLAGTLATKAGPASAPTDGSDTGNLKHWLFSLGIDSPVTKDTAGAAYHSELAKELEEFLDPVLARVGGILALVDVYCLFNRARGVGEYHFCLYTLGAGSRDPE
ncbi:Vacuolar protein-sorting-associated protein 36 [Tieghemiomyces parasiticus]|uniref:Vacuolar protein-sorting-associated protein 36 n=1 Tax=Tieghemiomyces parasiticus TaxID=78921 RepID=A0A9W8AI53_9FUNG|nr:Vacuolar protein-sorting-associated protein 36 [Tieghemiomyces parasiticus]